MKHALPILALSAGLVAGPALADGAPPAQALLGIAHQWAHINYQLPAGQKAAAFDALEKQDAALVKRYPDQAGPLIWDGIVLSSLAGAKGGLSALHLAKQARDRLLAANKIDPTALEGAADTSLGTLYSQVPGWPFGFGNDDKAEAYLKQALKIAPNDIDANYFYADFLYGKGRYQEAMQVLQKALAAPPRPGRPLADQGRRADVKALMAKVRSEAGNSIKSAEL